MMLYHSTRIIRGKSAKLETKASKYGGSRMKFLRKFKVQYFGNA